jgi:predicted MFS family arabinose efflux permease
MQMRVIYPFLPAISRGLGVPLQTTSLLLTARAVANLSSPLYGALSDRFGRRALMVAGLVILVTGTLFVALAPSFGAVVAAVAFLSLSKAVFDPAVLAYLGDAVPYERRGRMMAILAMMWPASWFVGVPVAGYLIDVTNWRAPFLFILALSVLALALLLRGRSIGASRAGQPWHLQQRLGPRAWLQQHLSGVSLQAWLAVSISLLLVLAAENVYIVYGAWLETEFGLTVTALGVVSVVIGVAELAAEGTCAGWVDRVGKRRAVIIGLVGNVLAYLLLPHLAVNLAAALLGLFLVYLTFDFSIVSAFPLLSELAPGARGTLMAVNVAAMAVGRLVSSLTAARLWSANGLTGNTTVSAAAALLALIVLARLVEERRPAAEMSV